MAIDRSNVQALRRLLKERLATTEAWATIAAHRLHAHRGDKGNDQAAALIAVAVLEQTLEGAIAVHFAAMNDSLRMKVFEGDHEREGILGTVYTRTIVARALGIFGDNTMRDILVLKDIRNLFAHGKRTIDFATDPLPSLCDFNVTRAVHAEAKLPLPDSPQVNFLTACEWLVSYLVLYEERRGHGEGLAWWKSFLT